MNEAENFFLKFRSLHDDGCNAKLNLVSQDGALWVSLMVELRGEKPARGASPTPAAPPPASAPAPPSKTQTKRRRRNGGRPARLKRREKREAARASIAANPFSPAEALAFPAEALASPAQPATAGVVEVFPATAALVEALPATAAVVEALPAPSTPTLVVEAALAPPAPAAMVEVGPAPALHAPAEVVDASPSLNTPKKVQLSSGRQKQSERGFSFIFPPLRNTMHRIGHSLRKKITRPDPIHSSPIKSSGAQPLLATEKEEEEDEWEDVSSDEEFSRFCNCSPPGNCLDCRNASSLYEFGDTTQPALGPIKPRRSSRLQQLGGNHW